MKLCFRRPPPAAVPPAQPGAAMPREEDVFDEASRLPACARAAVLDTLCKGRPALRARMAELLISHDVPAFMTAPAQVSFKDTSRLHPFPDAAEKR